MVVLVLVSWVAVRRLIGQMWCWLQWNDDDQVMLVVVFAGLTVWTLMLTVVVLPLGCWSGDAIVMMVFVWHWMIT